MTKFRKTITATVAALTLGLALAASSTEASARWGNRGWGAAAAVGVLGGLALGAAAANANGYYGGGYGGCEIQRRPVVDAWGDVVGYRRVRVCY